MSVLEIIATVLIGAGLLLAVVASVGLNRFDGVLMRLHAASKPQTLGLMLVFAGVSLVAQSWQLAGFLLVVLLAQMATVPVASVMVGRAAFRRGFVRGGDYSIDELSPRLADETDQDDDADGFIDEPGDDHEGMATDAEDRFPENVVDPDAAAHAVVASNWDEPEPGVPDDSDDDSIDVDLSEETEREAEEIAEQDPRP